MLTQSLAASYSNTGRLDDAIELANSVLEEAETTDNTVVMVLALLNRGFAEVMRGDLDAARRAGGEAARLAGDTRSVVPTWGGAVYGWALLEAGDADGAVEQLLQAGGGLELTQMPGLLRARFGEVLTRALIAAGRVEEAAEAALHCEARAAQAAVPLSRGAAERAGARLALATGDPAGAARRADIAAALAEECGAPIEVASCGAWGRPSTAGRGAASSTRPAWRRSPGVSSRSPSSSSIAGRTRRSPRSCSSASRRSRRTCATSSASSARGRASRSRGSSSAARRIRVSARCRGGAARSPLVA
jgi:hypothetical protein